MTQSRNGTVSSMPPPTVGQRIIARGWVLTAGRTRTALLTATMMSIVGRDGIDE